MSLQVGLVNPPHNIRPALFEEVRVDAGLLSHLGENQLHVDVFNAGYVIGEGLHKLGLLLVLIPFVEDRSDGRLSLLDAFHDQFFLLELLESSGQ